jgi:hypothetical protein
MSAPANDQPGPSAGVGQQQGMAFGGVSQPADIQLIDDAFITFDDFTHNALAESAFLPYGGVSPPMHESQIFQPVVTPGGETAGLDTPHTAFATAAAITSSPSEVFEITPVVERSINLWFEHQYPVSSRAS